MIREEIYTQTYVCGTAKHMCSCCSRMDRPAICPSSCAELIRRSTWLNEAGSGRKCWQVCVFDLFKMVINVLACVCVFVFLLVLLLPPTHTTSCWVDTDYTCVLKEAQANTMRNAKPRQRKTSFSPCLFHTFSAQWKLNRHCQKITAITTRTMSWLLCHSSSPKCLVRNVFIYYLQFCIVAVSFQHV